MIYLHPPNLHDTQAYLVGLWLHVGICLHTVPTWYIHTLPHTYLLHIQENLYLKAMDESQSKRGHSQTTFLKV